VAGLARAAPVAALLAALEALPGCSAPPGARLFVTNERSGDLSVIALRSNRVVATVPPPG